MGPLWFSCIDNTLNDLSLMHEIPVFCLLILRLLLTKESIPEEARVQNLESPAGRVSLKDRIVFFFFFTLSRVGGEQTASSP